MKFKRNFFLEFAKKRFERIRLHVLIIVVIVSAITVTMAMCIDGIAEMPPKRRPSVAR